MSPVGVVGRGTELELIRSALAAAVAGRGRVILVEGEPGIGKSALLHASLAGATDLGCEVGWAAADELSPRFPLRLLLDCLGIEARSPDPRRAGIAALLRRRPPGTGGATAVVSSADPMSAIVERILAIVDQLCADAPLVLVADDLQWADDASLVAWQRLGRTVGQLPLLLVAACRPVPHRAELDRLRTETNPGLIRLGPLPAPAVTEVVAGLAGAAPGPRLRALSTQAAGNPLYLRELVDALARANAITVVDGTAELAGDRTNRAPATLAAAIAGRLGFLSGEATVALRAAALLGTEFSVNDVAAVLDRPAADLVGVFAEATAAGVLTAGDHPSFRHPLIRQALYDSVPNAVRSALHQHAARALARAGASAERVAAQLLPASTMDSWTLDWLASTAAELADRAPAIAVELLDRALAQLDPDVAPWDELAGALARVLFRLGRNAEVQARQVLTHTPDPELAAEMRWILGERLLRDGRPDDALRAVEQGLAGPDVPEVWRARLTAMSGRILTNSLADLDAAQAGGERALAVAQRAGDRLSIAYCLYNLSSTYLMRRDQPTRLEYLDRALDTLGDDPEYLELRLLLLGNRMLALGLLDRFADVEKTLGAARDLAERRDGYAGVTRFHTPAAMVHFWSGRWDDALAELDAAGDLADNPRLVPTVAAIVSLIACHRDDRATAAGQLAPFEGVQLATTFDAVNSGFLIAARGLLAERDGQPEQAAEVMSEFLEPRYALMERYLSLPDVTRAALAVGDIATATRAAELCERDPGRHTPGRVAAVERCRGLLTRDPGLLAKAGTHLRAVGRVADYARNCEDTAILAARQGDSGAARSALMSATAVYEELGADWDLRRADAGVRPFGIRRGARGPRRRPAYGWAALSPTELRIAQLVAEGRSNPDIATELLLSRRTVQSHVSNILMKLKAQSRVDIARAARAHG
jgi:DNA-binding CsgD family transcriptional regulator/tetratricopeptide (TPR) repeat protein